MLGSCEQPGWLKEGTVCDESERAGEEAALEWSEPGHGSQTSEGLAHG